MSFFGNEHRYANLHILRERERIKKGQEVTNRIEELDRIKSAVRNAEFESSYQARLACAQRYRQLTLRRETALAREALNVVRRAALKNLLEQEEQQYSTELGQMGKAFYRHRK